MTREEALQFCTEKGHVMELVSSIGGLARYKCVHDGCEASLLVDNYVDGDYGYAGTALTHTCCNWRKIKNVFSDYSSYINQPTLHKKNGKLKMLKKQKELYQSVKSICSGVDETLMESVLIIVKDHVNYDYKLCKQTC
jgi:hypothetical protein